MTVVMIPRSWREPVNLTTIEIDGKLLVRRTEMTGCDSILLKNVFEQSDIFYGIIRHFGDV